MRSRSWNNSASKIAKAIADRDISTLAVSEHFLKRCRQFDSLISAWVNVDEEGTLKQAAARDAADGVGGLLGGVPIGVKDVIDVQGFATYAGSKTRAAEQPVRKDAAVVARLRNAGAVIMGKTVTTEYATMDPAPTRNPYRTNHTPGGSSSGSAAAVGAAMTPLAVGTQTAGSLCRPAAYCGVAAYKPSFGAVPTEGLIPLAPSFDTVGVIGRRVADVKLAGAAIMDRDLTTVGRRGGAVACLGVAAYRASVPEVQASYNASRNILWREGFSVDEIELPVDLDQVVSDHRIVMAGEAYQFHGHLLTLPEGVLGHHIGRLLAEGQDTSEIFVRDARERLSIAREAVWEALSGYTAILLQPVPAPAPATLSATGPTHYLVPWTTFGGPLIVVPGTLSADGLPLAAMIGAAPGNDADAFDIAERLASQLDVLPDFADAFSHAPGDNQ
jgi:aspartyl-tRNA(Asn)/glutamyl-tRNA(Gln) amidotransferase subunit A